MSRWGWLLAVALIAGCGRTTGEAPAPSSSLEVDPGELRALKTIQAELVEPLGLGELQEAFAVQTRIPELTQYPCSSCHVDPLPAKVESQVETRTAHVNMTIDHGKGGTLQCRTCHRSENLDELRLLDGQAVSLNHSYQVCAQCHFQQARDWVGGAHGKRLAGWRGKRVILSCAACHNPHSPALEPRFPVMFPQLPHADEQLSWDREGNHGD